MRCLWLLLFLTATSSCFSQEGIAAFRKEQRVVILVESGSKLLDQQLNPKERVEVISRMAEVLIQGGKYRFADSLLKILFRENHTPFGRAHAYKQKSLLNSYQSHFAEAFYCIQEAQKAVEKTEDITLNFYIQVDLMELCRRVGKIDDAELYSGKTEEYIAKHKLYNDRLQARFMNRKAAIWDEAGDQKMSPLKLSLLALDHAEKCGDLHLQAVSCNELGFFYKNQLKSALSYDFYTRAINNWTKVQRYQDAAYAFHNRIVLQFHNETRPAIEGIMECFELLEYIKEHHIDYPTYRIYHEMSAVYYNNIKDYEKAYYYRDKAHNEEIAFVNRSRDKEFAELLEKYKSDLLKDEIKHTEEKLESSTRNLTLKRQQATTLIIGAVVIFLLLVVVLILLMRTRRSRNQIAKQSGEKDFLIKEIHHRVKNNMAMISSLLEMQTTSSKHPLDQQTMNEITTRISSMWLVQEMLYTTNNEDVIELNLYIHKLIPLLYDSIEADVEIQFDETPQAIILSSRQSLALGILLSEMYINAAKYAFAKITNPTFLIHLSRNKSTKEITLIVSDNGPGTAEKITPATGGLGNRLIDIFSRQLNGTCTLDTTNGYTYTITFKQ